MGIEVEKPSTPEQRNQAIAAALKDIEKEYGKGAIFLMSDRVGQSVPHIPTGIYDLDYNVLGVGGLPRGRIVEVYGPESSGKTTLALLTVASAQRLGDRAAFIDVEHALDPNWATKLGVKVDDLLISQPDYGEQALSIVERLVESCAFGVIVVDSVAALVPKSELEGDMGDSSMGVQARLMSQAMRKLTGAVSKSGTLLLFINQVRDKIGVMFGSPETTTGGRALKFYASVRLDVRRIGAVKEGEVIIGNRTRIKAAKNKVSAPFREAEVDLLFSEGFDAVGNLLDVAVEKKVVEKSGSWFSYKGTRLGQGRNNAVQFVKDNHLLVDEFLKDIKERAA